MAKSAAVRAAARAPLSKDRVIDAGVEFADRHGVEALSMRRLAKELGVEAMSLYNHVANKDELLGGIIDRVTAEIELRRIAAFQSPFASGSSISAVTRSMIPPSSSSLFATWL
jgi:AcrR family transcriptional regulator